MTTQGQGDEPDAVVQAAAEVLFRDYESQYTADRLSWRDFADLASKVLAAAQQPMPAPEKTWTVIGFWNDGRIIVTGVVEGEHPVSGGDVTEISEQGCWAGFVVADDAESAESLAVEMTESAPEEE